MTTMKHIAAAGLLAAVASSAFAVPMTELDSSAFTYKYEMTVDPTTQDLDGDTNADWAYNNAAGVNLADGKLTLTNIRIESMVNGIWQSSNLHNATSWTLEISAALPDTSAPGVTDRFWGISTSTQNGATDHLVEVGQNAIDIPKQINALVKETFNTESNVGDTIFRIARDADGLWLWRNGELVNTESPDPGFNDAAVINRLMIGRYSSRLPGPVAIDFIRLTSGAHAPVPVPEPASLALMGSAALLLLRRRRFA